MGTMGILPVRKKEMRSCLRTFMDTHDMRDTVLTSFYPGNSEEDNKTKRKKAHDLIKKILASLGLKLGGTTKRVGTLDRRYVWTMQTSCIDFALTIALNPWWSNVIKGLLAQLLHSANLSRLDKEWVQEGISAYNSAASSADLPVIRFQRQERVYPVVARRRVELDMETNAHEDEARSENSRIREQQREADARVRLYQLGDAAQREINQQARLREERILERVRGIDEEQLSEDHMSDLSTDESTEMNFCPFLENEAFVN